MIRTSIIRVGPRALTLPPAVGVTIDLDHCSGADAIGISEHSMIVVKINHIVHGRYRRVSVEMRFR